MFSLILLLVFVFFLWGLFCYTLGHAKAWTRWDEATKGEKLSQATRDKIDGLL